MKSFDSVSVIGCGRWGSFLAWYLANYKKELNNILLYGKSESKTFQNLKASRKNEYLELPEKIELTNDLQKTLKNEYIIISIDAQNLKFLAKELNEYNLKNKTFILAMKGIDIESKQRLSQVMLNNINQNIRVAVLLGPGHVEDYTKGIPNCAVVDGINEEVKKDVVELMKSDLMRLYYGDDLIGNEIGGAYKNVIGISAGILDGLNWNSLKGALMARSIAEVSRFIERLGGKRCSACGLSFVGDFEATFDKINGKTLFYFDPPYRPLSNTSSFNNYSKEDFNDDAQIRLKQFCDRIHEAGAHFMLSNSDGRGKNIHDTFFDDLYSAYSIERVWASRCVNSNVSKRGKLTEILVSNFKFPTVCLPL